MENENIKEKVQSLHEHALSVLTFLTELSPSEMEFVLSMACAIFLNIKVRLKMKHSNDFLDMVKDLYDNDDEVFNVAQNDEMYEFFKKIDLQMKSTMNFVEI